MIYTPKNLRMSLLSRLLTPLIASLVALSVAAAQTDEQLGLHSDGGPWRFHPADNEAKDLPDVLLIGDSIMNAYRALVVDQLKGKANVHCWLTPAHLKSEGLFDDIAKVAAFRDYDVIHFNIGLHGWQEDRVSNEEFAKLFPEYVSVLQAKAPGAKLVWASITPIHKEGTQEIDDQLNPRMVARNQAAAQVAEERGIRVDDLYGLLEDKLHLVRGDRWHWQPEACRLMGDQVVRVLKAELAGRGGSSDRAEMPREAYTVSWDSLGRSSLDSMPIGNGDLGVNVWTEADGDIVFYLSKTDAWSENGRLLKLGKLRIELSPNPFEEASDFRQTLSLEDGVVKFSAGAGDEEVEVILWVDANHPVVELEVESRRPHEIRTTFEPWRTERRKLAGAEAHSAYGLHDGKEPIWVEPDTVLDRQRDRIVWYHRNERSIWKDNLELQSLGSLTARQEDPLLHRTFGAVVTGNGLVSESPSILRSSKPGTKFSVSVQALTSRTGTAGEWVNELAAAWKEVQDASRDERVRAHREWWSHFWDRSFIHVSSDDPKEAALTKEVTRGYALQRWMNVCGGRGASPIKFNGSIFTVDTMNHDDKFKGFDADYRQWGGPYWWQNTRLPYWSMISAGDFDLMEPIWKMYKDALPVRRAATKAYYGHEGAFYPETIYFWGTYVDANYGRDRKGKPDGLTDNRYIRYYWSSGLEFSMMMLDQFEHTRSRAFAEEFLVPIASEVITFYDQHWERDASGKIRFDPAMALETYGRAVNPIVEIVGIEEVCRGLLALPDAVVPAGRKTQWKRLISELPPMPVKEVDGRSILQPAEQFSGKQNSENPELYTIFPYRRFVVGKPNLDLAKRTFDRRAHKGSGGWQQSAIQAAYLGLADEAARLTAHNFTHKNGHHRFPAMWGPNYDWIPDQCHGAVAMIALQRMLLQHEGEKVRLLPAWPRKWNVDFKLAAPGDSTVEGSVRNGEVSFNVDPAVRRSDVEVMPAQ